MKSIYVTRGKRNVVRPYGVAGGKFQLTLRAGRTLFTAASALSQSHRAVTPTRRVGKILVDPRQLLKQVRYPFIEACRVKRIGKTQQLVVQMMAEFM